MSYLNNSLLFLRLKLKNHNYLLYFYNSVGLYNLKSNIMDIFRFIINVIFYSSFVMVREIRRLFPPQPVSDENGKVSHEAFNPAFITNSGKTYRGNRIGKLLWLNVTLKSNALRWRKLATIVAVCCCYISAFVLTCFHLTKHRATLFRRETNVAVIFRHSLLTCFRLTKGRAMFFSNTASFLHLMVVFFKVIFNYTSKRQFVVLLFHR